MAGVVDVLTTNDAPIGDRSAPQSGLATIGPSPGHAPIHVRFAMATAGEIRVEIFDALGRQIHRLDPDWLPAGSHDLEWDGRRGDGTRLAAGAYFVRLETPTLVQSAKTILLQ